MTTASQVNIKRALEIGGWMSERELTWLAEKAHDCFTIVEFGSFHGRSTRALADNVSSGGQIWAVDPWNGDYQTEDGDTLQQVNTYCYPNFYDNLKDKIIGKVVTPIRGFSYNFSLPFFVDMVFIDGDHRYKTVFKDIATALALTKPGGIISGHDYGHPLWTGVKQAVDEIFPNKIQVEDTIWWTLK